MKISLLRWIGSFLCGTLLANFCPDVGNFHFFWYVGAYCFLKCFQQKCEKWSEICLKYGFYGLSFDFPGDLVTHTGDREISSV